LGVTTQKVPAFSQTPHCRGLFKFSLTAPNEVPHPYETLKWLLLEGRQDVGASRLTTDLDGNLTQPGS
jgi:hypothetical protein